MSGGEVVIEPDRWPLSRRQSFGLRSHRVLPGPLRAMPRRQRRPVWLAGLAGLSLAGLSLAAVFTLAPHPAATGGSEPAPKAAETMPAPRVVGAAEVHAPAAPAVAATPTVDAPGAEPPTLRTAQSEPESAPAATPAPKRAAVPPLDLGQLPVLRLDATTFEAPPLADATPRQPARAPARPPAPRIAAQP